MGRKILGCVLALFCMSLFSCGEEGISTSISSIDSSSQKSSTSTKAFYTVSWENYDGSLLEYDRRVEEGSMPSYDGSTPIRNDNEEYTYLFSHWNPTPAPVYSNQIYRAVFDATRLEITRNVDFDLNGGYSPSYKGPIRISSLDDPRFFFDCQKEGYAFRGWSYNGQQVFDQDGNIVSSPKLTEGMVFQAMYTNTVRLTLTQNIKEAGTVSGDGEYPLNSSVTLQATVFNHYLFLGWYINGSFLSKATTCRYRLSTEDVEIEAVFEVDGYAMTLFTNQSEFGGVRLSSRPDDYSNYITGKYLYNTPVTAFASSYGDVAFLGWYDEDGALVSPLSEYTFSMPGNDYLLEGKWDYFYVHYELDEGSNSPANPDHFTIDSGYITLEDPTREGYRFVGWEIDGEPITTLDPSLLEDVTVVAVWESLRRELTVLSEDETKGYVEIVSGESLVGETIVVSATPLDGWFFEGWFDGDNRLSREKEYSFEMPVDDFVLTARFWSEEEEEAELYKEWGYAHGVTPVLNEESKTVTYGLYPQTVVADNALIESLEALPQQESDSWYELENEYYVKVVANTYESSANFDDGSEIVKGKPYWFHCEPVVWRVISDKDGYYLLSDRLLDAKAFCTRSTAIEDGGETVYPNNYKYSTIRSWMNNEFLNTAFALDDSYLLTVSVDNGEATTRDVPNAYACEPTEDKVFLPSYMDYVNADYGFTATISATMTREAKTTDYARAKMAHSSVNEALYHNGWYWTRSPVGSDPNKAYRVGDEGYMTFGGVTNGYSGFRPAIRIDL